MDFIYQLSFHVDLFLSIANFESSPAYNKDPLRKLIFYCYDRYFLVILVREPWRPKAYRDNPQAPARNVGTAVYHAQYNSPIGLYSDDKVLEAFKSQTGSLIDDIKGYEYFPNRWYTHFDCQLILERAETMIHHHRITMNNNNKIILHQHIKQ